MTAPVLRSQMAYRDLDFAQRFATLGDESERVFVEVSPLGKTEVFGWRRPSVSMSKMSPFIRSMPDFYAASGHLVECVGCGRDGTVKLKLVKYDALREWNKQQPVALWVWNSSTSEWVVIDFDAVKRHVGAARRRGDVRAFENDGNEYYAIPFADLYADPTAVKGTW